MTTESNSAGLRGRREEKGMEILEGRMGPPAARVYMSVVSVYGYKRTNLGWPYNHLFISWSRLLSRIGRLVFFILVLVLLYRSGDITANHSITGRQPARTGIKEPNWNYLFILRMGKVCKISPNRQNHSFIPVLAFIPV